MNVFFPNRSAHYRKPKIFNKATLGNLLGSVCTHTKLHAPYLSPDFNLYFCVFITHLQARNIAVCVEFKDSDEDKAQQLKVYLHKTLCSSHYICLSALG